MEGLLVFGLGAGLLGGGFAQNFTRTVEGVDDVAVRVMKFLEKVWVGVVRNCFFERIYG